MTGTVSAVAGAVLELPTRGIPVRNPSHISAPSNVPDALNKEALKGGDGWETVGSKKG